jgi:hypothetical protein
MYRHITAASPVSMLDRIGTRFADRDEQVSNCPRAGSDC